MLDKLTYNNFTACLHTPFQLELPGSGPIIFDLYEVTRGPAVSGTELFSLYFRGPLKPCLAQSIQRLVHEKLGAFDIFIVPIGPDGQGMCYESVFNRFHQAEATA